MTIVMTFLASDNARNRRRAKRAAERNTSMTGCTDRVLRAVTAPGMRSKPDPSAGSICMGDVAIYSAGFRKKTDSVSAR